MILFIDDETEFVRPYQEGLEDAGFRVEMVSSIDEAHKTILDRYSNLDLIIFDVMMPGNAEVLAARDTLGGRRAGEQLLALVLEWEQDVLAPQPVPKIVLTNIDDPVFHERWRAEGSGVDACLRKTQTSVEKLVATVLECVGTC